MGESFPVMCGRYALARRADALARLFGAWEAPGVHEAFEPSHNIAPTRQVLGLAMTQARDRVLDTYRWGLIPWWATDPAIGNRLFNARAATLSTSQAFADAFARRRLALVADGFFEWRPGSDGRRRPLFFQRADGAPLLFAGLWERWRDPAPRADEPLLSCTIVTTEAGPDLLGIHDRMPVILEPEALDRWLDGTEGAGLLRPSPAGTLVHHPVDPRVGDVRNDGADLVAPYEEQELRLFD
ncbi:MAG: SOS response-associated peptidase [Actinomycetota bacterium]|nr:SOS response-associated peptidase [Actinomycetota bacterium]